MKHSSRIIAFLAIFAAAFLPHQTSAQFTFATDNAGNSAYTDGWTSGDNGGSGWNSWTLTTDASGATNFIGNPSAAGISTNALGDVAFGMRATVANNYANISRDLSTGMGTGDSLSFDWGVNWDTDSSSQFKGFTLRDGDIQLFNVNMSGSTIIRVNDTDTGFAYGTDAMRVTVTRTTSGYSFSMTSKSGSATFTTNISSTATINRFTAYAANNNADINRNIYFDNFSNTNSGVFASGGTVTNANTFSGSGALSIGNNTTLVLSGGGNNNYTGTTTISNNSTLVFAGAGTSTFASAIGGSGGNLVMSNTNGLVVLTNNNAYTGNTTVAAGALLIARSNALGSTGALAVNPTGQLQLSNGIAINRAITLSGDGIGFAGALRNMSGSNAWQGTISNANGARINAEAGSTLTLSNINSGTNNLYLGGAGNITIGGLIAGTQTGGNGAIYKDGSGVLTLTNDNTGLTGLVRLLGGTISITNNNSLGGGVLELGGLGTQAILSVGNSTTRSQNILIQNASTNSVINVAAGSAFTVTGSLTQDGALANTTKFGKLGSGTLILAGASGNTYNGQIQIGEGTVIAGTASALGVNTTTAQRGVDLGLNVTDVSQTNNVALLASNGVTISNSFYVAPNTSGALRTIGLSGAGSATFNNEFYMDGILTVDAGGNATDSITMSGNLVHVGGVSKTNSGILILSGSASTFSGGVTLGQGTLRVGANGALGSGGFSINGGTFASDGSAARTITNNITMGGNATLGDATGTGALTLSNINLNGTTRTLTVANNSTVVGVISNGSATPGLTKDGAGTLTLAGTNTYTGITTINAGVLAVTNGSAIDNAGAVSLADAANAIFAVNGSETIGSLRGGGSTGGNVSIATNQILTVAETGAQTFAGRITNAGTLVKSGAGTTTLTGANSYSGGTVVSGGRLVGDTRSLQGPITNTAAVTFDQTTNGSYTGLISGAAGTLTKSGSGTVTFTANNTYTGATTVSGGRLIVNGSQTNSAVTVNSGASLGGSGAVGALTVSGLVAPGNSIGTLSAGNTVFNGGGSLELEIFDWVNSAGTGWDLLAITGNLTLSNTSGSQFAINLVSLTNSTTPGLSTDWNPNVNFTNTFITYTGSLLGTPFASSLFTVNTGSFSNTINGTFSITNVSGGLALLYTTAFAPTSSIYNWNAGSGLWGTAGNWTNGFAPTNGSSIIFSGAGGASTNSSTVSSIQGIVFTNGAGAYTVSGTALAVGTGGISNASTATQTISNNLSLSANAAITAANGNVILAGNLTNGGNAVSVGGASNTSINGVVSGSGTLAKSGDGTLSLTAANTYAGATTISGGTVVATDNASLGATNGGTTVQSGATLQLSGGITTAENITITGSGVGNSGAIRSLGDGENTISGNIVLGGNARINADAPIGSVTALANWGTNNLTVDPGNTTFPTNFYSQTGTVMTMNGTPALGATLAALLAGGDWSDISNLGLEMSITGANNNLSFTLELFDSDFSIAQTYTGSTVGIGSSPGVALLDLSSIGTGVLTNVSGIQFTWNDSDAINTTFSSFVSVPTSGLLISGNVNGGTNVLTVGSAASGSGAVADGVRFTGVISGAGGTYEGTATSLVKDGGGTVYLSGDNTFTGDVRILDGILNIIFGASPNALGVGSDLFLSSLGTLQVDSNVSVSSFQGAGEGNAGNVQLNGGSVLTVNGAGKTMTMAGDIGGFGGLRIAGNSSTLVTLTGNNTFSQATVITNGATLALAGTGGDQALGSSGSVTIHSGAKLLLQTSDQVRDNAAVTLSGGTIQRASGVNEVFGKLTLNSASFLDYGTGAVGTLRFAESYTPSALLTVQNFLPGNKLQFGSTLTQAQLDNPSFFAFSNGFTTSTEDGFFTITAIPEPSTYLAAAGLIALLLYSFRRPRRSSAKVEE